MSKMVEISLTIYATGLLFATYLLTAIPVALFARDVNLLGGQE